MKLKSRKKYLNKIKEFEIYQETLTHFDMNSYYYYGCYMLVKMKMSKKKMMMMMKKGK